MSKILAFRKSVCTMLYMLVQCIVRPLTALGGLLAMGAGAKRGDPMEESGSTWKREDLSADAARNYFELLFDFLDACMDRVEQIRLDKEQDIESIAQEEEAWRYVAVLQEAADEAGMDVNFLEIFGRVEASTCVNDLRRTVRGLLRDTSGLEAVQKLKAIRAAVKFQMDWAERNSKAALDGEPLPKTDDMGDREFTIGMRVVMADVQEDSMRRIQHILDMSPERVQKTLADFENGTAV